MVTKSEYIRAREIVDEYESEKSKRECGRCKFFEQGKGCSFCGNPKQTDENKRKYLYYNFTCDLFTPGIAESRVKYINSLK